MSSPFTLEAFAYQGLVYLTLGGAIDRSTSDLIDQAIIGHLRTDVTAGVVIDLAAVTFLDSAGISSLAAGRWLAEQAVVPYRVINAPAGVLRTLDLAAASPNPYTEPPSVVIRKARAASRARDRFRVRYTGESATNAHADQAPA
jgi:anti-sigma B factor antagonist